MSEELMVAVTQQGKTYHMPYTRKDIGTQCVHWRPYVTQWPESSAVREGMVRCKRCRFSR